MTPTTDQTTSTTAPSIEELRADLADAEAELQGLPAATTAARTGGHSTEWMGLLTRAEQLRRPQRRRRRRRNRPTRGPDEETEVPLTSKQILQALALPPGDGSYGTLMAWRRSIDADRENWDHAEWTFLDELMQHRQPQTERYAHPTTMPRPSGRQPGGTGEPQPLEPGDLVWLQRLPSDPAKISDEDAAYIATLAREARPGSSDARLLKSILDPIRRHHDKRQAQVELRNHDATKPRPTPRNARAVLAAAVLRETNDLDDDEAHTRARRMIDQVTAEVTAKRAQERAQTQTRIKELSH